MSEKHIDDPTSEKDLTSQPPPKHIPAEGARRTEAEPAQLEEERQRQ